MKIASAVHLILIRWREHLLLTRREIRRSKVNFCLGWSSCFLVVFLVALLDTSLSIAPIAFLKLAEGTNGEADMNLSISGSTGAFFINYTTASNRLGNDPGTTFHSPRYIDTVHVYRSSACNQDIATTEPDPSRDWRYVPTTASDCNKSPNEISLDQSCFASVCPSHVRSTFYVIDTEKERHIGYGRTWKLPPAPSGSVYMHSSIAREAGVGPGDKVWIRLDATLLVRSLWPTIQGVTNQENIVYVPFQVDQIFSNIGGKAPQDAKDMIVTEWSNVVAIVTNFNPTLLSRANMTSMSTSTFTPTDFSTTLAVNMPNRLDAYINSDFDIVKKNVVQFASKVLYRLGFDQVDSTLPILDSLTQSNVFALYLALLLSIIFALLLILSILLIYSLLMISVQTRTFELGVLRMVGMTRYGLVELLLVQALMYAIPAWALGLIGAQGAAVLLFRYISRLVDMAIPNRLLTRSIIAATVLAYTIPLISAVFPIRSALSLNLQDCLDVRHSKTKAVVYSIERSEDAKVSPAIIFSGLLLTVAGFLIYYLVPLALISFNITLLLYIFFCLLMGMIAGCVILALNFEHLLARLVVFVFFFYERWHVRNLVVKNLTAHRPRNRKTTVMYSLALGFIIFLAVGANLQIATFAYQLQQRSGVFIRVRSSWPDFIKNPDALESFVLGSKAVDKHCWVTHELADVIASSTGIENLGHVYSDSVQIYGVSPSLYDVGLGQFLIVSDSVTRNSLSADLYSLEGSQSAIIGSLYMQNLGLSMQGSFLLNVARFRDDPYTRLKPLAFLDLSPAFKFSKFPSISSQDVLVSLPMFVELTRGRYQSVLELPMRQLLLKISNDATEQDKDDLIAHLDQLLGGQGDVTVWDYRDRIGSIASAGAILNTFFNISIVLAMFLCLFSLTSSMYANIYEQTKEIGVLRAIGSGRFMLVRVYVYESFALVVSASLMGVCIGFLIGYTMTIQRVLLTQLPMPFYVPWVLILIILAMAAFCAVVSSMWPAYSVVRKSTVSIMRITT